MAVIGPVEAFERRRGEIARTQENAARLASVFSTCTTTGLGQHLIAQEMVFGVAFSEEPRVTYSCVFKDLHKYPVWPRCQGGVHTWVQDAKGFYTGAHVAVTVDTAPGVLGDSPHEVQHVFGFFAVALKFIPAHLLA